MAACIDKIFAGTNGTIEWPFLKKDGTQLDFSADVESTVVEFIQNSRVKASFTLGTDDEVRAAVDLNGIKILEVEYTIDLTTRLLEKNIPTFLKVTIVADNDELEVDEDGKYKVQRELFVVI